MVDEQRVAEKLRMIRENLDKLSLFKGVPVHSFISDFKEYDSAKYNLQTTIEAMLDICNHIIARNAYEVPKTNADAFRLLCRKKILSADMEDTYTAMARFRNRVVHLYDQVDSREIFRMINENLADFERFLEDIKNVMHL